MFSHNNSKKEQRRSFFHIFDGATHNPRTRPSVLTSTPPSRNASKPTQDKRQIHSSHHHSSQKHSSISRKLLPTDSAKPPLKNTPSVSSQKHKVSGTVSQNTITNDSIRNSEKLKTPHGNSTVPLDPKRALNTKNTREANTIHTTDQDPYRQPSVPLFETNDVFERYAPQQLHPTADKPDIDYFTGVNPNPRVVDRPKPPVAEAPQPQHKILNSLPKIDTTECQSPAQQLVDDIDVYLSQQDRTTDFSGQFPRIPDYDRSTTQPTPVQPLFQETKVPAPLNILQLENERRYDIFTNSANFESNQSVNSGEESEDFSFTESISDVAASVTPPLSQEVTSDSIDASVLAENNTDSGAVYNSDISQDISGEYPYREEEFDMDMVPTGSESPVRDLGLGVFPNNASSTPDVLEVVGNSAISTSEHTGSSPIFMGSEMGKSFIHSSTSQIEKASVISYPSGVNGVEQPQRTLRVVNPSESLVELNKENQNMEQNMEQSRSSAESSLDGGGYNKGHPNVDEGPEGLAAVNNAPNTNLDSGNARRIGTNVEVSSIYRDFVPHDSERTLKVANPTVLSPSSSTILNPKPSSSAIKMASPLNEMVEAPPVENSSENKDSQLSYSESFTETPRRFRITNEEAINFDNVEDPMLSSSDEEDLATMQFSKLSSTSPISKGLGPAPLGPPTFVDPFHKDSNIIPDISPTLGQDLQTSSQKVDLTSIVSSNLNQSVITEKDATPSSPVKSAVSTIDTVSRKATKTERPARLVSSYVEELRLKYYKTSNFLQAPPNLPMFLKQKNNLTQPRSIRVRIRTSSRQVGIKHGRVKQKLLASETAEQDGIGLNGASSKFVDHTREFHNLLNKDDNEKNKDEYDSDDYLKDIPGDEAYDSDDFLAPLREKGGYPTNEKKGVSRSDTVLSYYTRSQNHMMKKNLGAAAFSHKLPVDISIDDYREKDENDGEEGEEGGIGDLGQFERSHASMRRNSGTVKVSYPGLTGLHVTNPDTDLG